MLYIITGAVVFAIALGSASAQTSLYSRQSLKTAMPTANTTTEFNRLALYFEDRSACFRKLSEEHEKTLRHELEHPTVGAKYPTAVDRARRFKDYYLEQSRKAHNQSERFKTLASKDTATDGAR